MSINSKLQGKAANLKADTKRVTSRATMSPVVENWVRLGYVARGVVYAMIGLLALQAAIGGGGALTDPQGAIATMGKTPVGGLVQYIILAGMVGYGLWGLIRAIFDPLHKGTDAKGIAMRVGYAISGISYLLLGLFTYDLIKGTGAHGKGQTAQTQLTVGTILSKPWGAWVIAIVALIVVGDGLWQIRQGTYQAFSDQYKIYALSAYRRKWIERLGRFGIAARGVVFALIGFFLFVAAYTHNPNNAQGIDGVLRSLMHQSYGPWLVAVVALGLIAFGVYSALSGFWLRIRR